jgi:hypothetical protein
MDHIDEPVPSRRKAFAMIFAALAGSAVVLATTSDAEARGGRGRGGGRGGRGTPFGWSRGRKRGWAKRGGPKWRW